MTATIIDQLEKSAGNVANQRHHIKNLVDVLGDGTEWSYTGTVIDAGVGATMKMNPPRCACQHPIRFQFILQHNTDGRQAAVGSTCINHFVDANPATYQALKDAETRLIADLKAKEQQAKQALQQEQVDALKVEFEAVRDKVLALYRSYEVKRTWQNKYPTPSWLWYLVNRNWKFCPRYTRPTDYIKWYTKQTAAVRKTCADNGLTV